MKRLPALLLTALCITFASASVARARDVAASPWLDFGDAKIRLLALSSGDKVAPLVAGLEIRLAPGFKTYWRSVGDSGVPPSFDFTKSVGLESIRVDFPFPASFDDGAGGQAWGYKHAVILPISARREGMGFRLDLKLDFAVCGTMCIPLSGELQFDPAQAVLVSEQEAHALDRALLSVPTRLGEGAEPAVKSRRHQPLDPPLWSVRVPFDGGIEHFSAFPEATGFLEVKSAEPEGNGFVRLMIAGQAAPGSGGKFGPLRLTYGRPGLAFERMIDLDGAATSP